MKNKIYKNLNTKTEWFNQFDLYQQEEILAGLERNLDISIYAKKEFDDYKMWQIRLGLEDNLDVSLYGLIKW